MNQVLSHLYIIPWNESGTSYFPQRQSGVITAAVGKAFEQAKEDAKFPFKVKNTAKEREAAPQEVYSIKYKILVWKNA